jgi:hypothetical protein
MNYSTIMFFRKARRVDREEAEQFGGSWEATDSIS